MGFFNRRRDAPRQPRAAAPRNKSRAGLFRSPEPYTMERRPPFGQWLKVSWLDILTIIILLIISFLVYRAPSPGTRTFPLAINSNGEPSNRGEVVYPQFAYPDRGQIIASWLDALLAVAIPIVAILLMNLIRIRSFWDINNGIFGVLYAIVPSSCFQVMIKWLIGGLRPNFYDICKPDLELAAQQMHNTTGLNGVGYQQYMFTDEICTSDNKDAIKNALQSFPSGHSTTIFAGMVFLYLYLNAKFKVWANYHPSLWKLVLVYLPILGACLIVGSLTVDQTHNWYDILAGATIGTVFAFSAYRMVYGSVWDYRTNHIPLNRHSPFIYSDGCEGSDMTFTKKAGWRAGSLRGGRMAARGVTVSGTPIAAAALAFAATIWCRVLIVR
ncbi:phosphatidic acid phosphatase type 2/haloperoxidase [Microdochium bolleyi]|uniref:Phosphatidic acid phosphatase type 2/haloperoxidase n=1 Tax=Microdochium bolleyi TaxID=196109 RepID=A0A136J110_9PEZI|nr:phosphatidic acid phosphatase type 2/haloperoxidase [Microdochium bolleyi]